MSLHFHPYSIFSLGKGWRVGVSVIAQWYLCSTQEKAEHFLPAAGCCLAQGDRVRV